MTIEVKKVEDGDRFFEFREMSLSSGATVQASTVNGKEVTSESVNNIVTRLEKNKETIKDKIDYWTDIKNKLGAVIAKEV